MKDQERLGVSTYFEI